jgi:HK97 family phage major capsid protein
MLKQLREKFAKIATDMRAMHKLAEDEDRGFTAEERTKWDAMLADYEETELRIKDAERVAKMEAVPEDRALPAFDREQRAEDSAPQSPREVRATPEYDEAYDTFMRMGSSSLSAEQRQMLTANQAAMEVRAQGIATDGAGGFTVPEGFAGMITERMVDFSGLYGAANPGGNGGPTLLRTASGNTIPFPTNDDTGNVGELLAENTAAAEQDTVFGARNLTSYMFSSKLIRVSLQLLQDEEVNLVSYLANILGKRLGRAAAPYFSNGTGTAQPTGLATAATDNALNLSVAAGYSYAHLLDFEHSLDPAYRGGAAWVFNDATLKALKGLLDGNNRPLWLPGDAAGMATGARAASLMGYKYIIDQSFDDLAIGGNYMAFGDLSEFHIREVLGINLFRFNERYMDALQIGWLGYARWDSNLIDVNAVVTDIAVA